MEKEIPKIGEKYKHFKGSVYEVIGTPINADYNDGRISILYIDQEGSVKYPQKTIFSSSLERFVSDKFFEMDCEYNGVEYKKGDKVKRFTKI